jgi:excisionase family DNA binding protein
MTVAQAAKHIGISASKMYGLIAAREVSFYRVGGKIILLQADIDAYLARCHVAAVAPVATVPRARLSLKHIRLKPA